MNPREKRWLVDRLNEQLGRPIRDLSFEPMDGCYSAVLFLDEPWSGAYVSHPKDSILIYTPDDEVQDTMNREVLWAFFY